MAGIAGDVLTPQGAQALGPGTVRLMAVAAGLFVASIYFNQPILGLMARDFHLGVGDVPLIPTLTQVGYAAGLLLLTPLGDRFERRGLICLTALALAAAMAWTALAPSFGALVAASLCVGLLATVAQQVVPMAVQLAPDNARGRVLGTVMAGVLTGILLARTVSGVVAEHGGWRLVFGLAAAANVVMSGILALKLPKAEPTTRISYPRIMASLLRLLREHRALRRAGLTQGLLFAGFIGFWANVALFLEQPPFSQGSSVAGLLGLIGVVGILIAPLAGRLADKDGHGRMIALGASAVLAAFALFGFLRTSWIALVAGIVVMDVGSQASMISNQTRIYALDATARSRLNTVYMTTMFLGGAAGAAVAGHAFALFGWTGVCAMGACCAAGALGIELLCCKPPTLGAAGDARRES